MRSRPPEWPRSRQKRRYSTMPSYPRLPEALLSNTRAALNLVLFPDDCADVANDFVAAHRGRSRFPGRQQRRRRKEPTRAVGLKLRTGLAARFIPTLIVCGLMVVPVFPCGG